MISSRTNCRIQASCSSNSGSVEKSHATWSLLSMFRLDPRANYRNGMPGDATATPIRTTVTISAPNRGGRRAEPERPAIDPADGPRALGRGRHRPAGRASAADRRGARRPGCPARRVGHLPGGSGPPGPPGVVRARGGGRGHPVGQDRGLPRGLPLLLPVVPIRHAGQGHAVPRHRRGARRPPRRPRPPGPPSSASCWRSGVPTSAPCNGSSSWSR